MKRAARRQRLKRFVAQALGTKTGKGNALAVSREANRGGRKLGAIRGMVARSGGGAATSPDPGKDERYGGMSGKQNPQRVV